MNFMLVIHEKAYFMIGVISREYGLLSISTIILSFENSRSGEELMKIGRVILIIISL